jgi:nucleoside-diphosphate-sugar epimerase
MQIAIFGANSQIAKDLVRSLALDSNLELHFFVRRPAEFIIWLGKVFPGRRFVVAEYGTFGIEHPYDAIINFVGSGNPIHTAAMGADIFEVTHQFDELALTYLRKNPNCGYIFFSSGAAYGGDFTRPASEEALAAIPLNELKPRDWYGAAKLFAECRHRSLSEYFIVDLRVFNYFSSYQDIEARFLITDVLRAIRDQQVFRTSGEKIWRDYAGPDEISQLITKILKSKRVNAAVDCYSCSPLDKLSMLDALRLEFGLSYEITTEHTGVTATGDKVNYYSKNRKASALFGYAPQATSLEVVLNQSRRMLSSL